MIRIHKPATAPPKLMTEGKKKAAEHHTEYSRLQNLKNAPIYTTIISSSNNLYSSILAKTNPVNTSASDVKYLMRSEETKKEKQLLRI
jgi:hypothetical protein